MQAGQSKPLSQAIAEAAELAERAAIALRYDDMSPFKRPLRDDVADGRVAVGAMDGWTVDVPVRA